MSSGQMLGNADLEDVSHAEVASGSDFFGAFDMQDITLRNRVVMPALTRGRAVNPGLVPTDLMATYYEQRASAGLIVTEGTWVSATAIGRANVPGLFTAEQVAGWRKITNAVHRRGGKIIAQLWHVGALSHPALLNGQLPASASAVNPNLRAYTPDGALDTLAPREMSREDVRSLIGDFANAARNAREAGFDGVQIQANFQYVFAQFLHTSLNLRADHYGGSTENRARLLFDTLDAVLAIMGGRGVGLKVGPSCDEAGLLAANEQTIPTLDYILTKLNSYDLSHVFIMGMQTDVSQTPVAPLAEDGILHHARKFYRGIIVANGGLDLARASRIVTSGMAELVAFGRFFLGNPDLVERFRDGIPLASLREEDSYAVLRDPAEGYTDYPHANLAPYDTSAMGGPTPHDIDCC